MSYGFQSEEELRTTLQSLERVDARVLEKLGYRVERCDYYSPINSIRFLEANEDLWLPPRIPACIDWRTAHQLDVAAEIAQFIPELRDVPDESTTPGEYFWNNDFFNNADALVHYGLIRSRKPKQIIEIGCGYSSLLMAKALAANALDLPQEQTAVINIEPNPRTEIMSLLPSGWRQVHSILQRTPLELFRMLQAGDILFYDGSHCCRTASDVNWFFFEILPILQQGVLIHVHDIMFPNDYPRAWLIDRLQSWNEQYLLQAFLMHNEAYEVEIANAYLAHVEGPRLQQFYGGIQPYWGASLWMTKVRASGGKAV